MTLFVLVRKGSNLETTATSISGIADMGWEDADWHLFRVRTKALWQMAKANADAIAIPPLSRAGKGLPAAAKTWLQGKGIAIEPDDTIHELLVKLTGDEELGIDN